MQLKRLGSSLLDASALPLRIYCRSITGKLSLSCYLFYATLQTDRSGIKKILCMPGGGLNDLLCVTLHFYKYSIRSSRRLYIGSKYSSVGPLNQLFSGWPKAIRFINQNYDLLFNSVKDFFPPTSKDYIESEDSDLGVFISENSKDYISFDVRKSYGSDMLVHVGRGGGFGFDLLRRLRLKEPYRSHVIRILSSLPPVYESVQVRNTDIVTDWEQILECTASKPSTLPLLICSDSNLVIESFKSRLSGLRKVISLRSANSTSDSAPIHYSNTQTLFERNAEMLSDLFAMALSKKLYVARSAQGVSGFPRLALSLNLHKRTVLRILSCNNLDQPTA